LAWASQFDHGFLAITTRQPEVRLDVLPILAAKWAIVEAPDEEGWVLRLDADAILGNFEVDMLTRKYLSVVIHRARAPIKVLDMKT